MAYTYMCMVFAFVNTFYICICECSKENALVSVCYGYQTCKCD